MPNPLGPDGEQTADPRYADARNFYKVEQWTKDGLHIEYLLYAGNLLEKARAVFATFVKKRPRANLTIRQRTLVLEKWPPNKP